MKEARHTDLVITGSITEMLAERLIEELQHERYQRDIPLRLFLNSPGGNMPVALAMSRLLLSSFETIETYNLATVDSAAVCLYLIGGKRCTFESSRFYLHPPTIPHDGPLSRENLHELSLLLHSDTEAMIAFYQERTGIDAELLRAWFQQHTVLSGPQSIEQKISTELCSAIDDFAPRYIQSPIMPLSPCPTAQPGIPSGDSHNPFSDSPVHE